MDVLNSNMINNDKNVDMKFHPQILNKSWKNHISLQKNSTQFSMDRILHWNLSAMTDHLNCCFINVCMIFQIITK